jgi:hypothetical protein
MLKNKNHKIMKKVIFILAFVCPLAIFAQGEAGNTWETSDDTIRIVNTPFKSRIIVPENAIAFNLGYNIPMLNNEVMKYDFWKKEIGTGLDFSVDYRRQFQKYVIEDNEVVTMPTWLAMGAGLGISYIRESAWLENHSESFLFKDKDDDNCTVKLDYTDVKESISLTYLDIPVYVEIGRPSRVKISGFAKIGVKASLLMSKKVKGEGTYTSTGFYPEWNVTLRNIPELGYYTHENCYQNPDYKASPFVLWGSVSGGVNFPFSSVEKNRIANWILRVSAKIDYSLTPISKPLPDTYFSDASFRLNQSNILGGNGSKILAAGITVGLIYCL